jgi:hypothetical protein
MSNSWSAVRAVNSDTFLPTTLWGCKPTRPPPPALFAPCGLAVLDNPDSVGHSCLVSWRGSVKSKKTKEKDPYLVALGRIWPTILLAYDDFKDLKPVVEYRLWQKIVLAYPALPYINDLTKRTREQARQICRDVLAGGRFMVFVCDTRKRVLRSYVFPVEKPEVARSESTVS